MRKPTFRSNLKGIINARLRSVIGDVLVRLLGGREKKHRKQCFRIEKKLENCIQCFFSIYKQVNLTALSLLNCTLLPMKLE